MSGCVLVCWCAGWLVCWCAGWLVCWCAGVLTCWVFFFLLCWCAVVLVCFFLPVCSFAGWLWCCLVSVLCGGVLISRCTSAHPFQLGSQGTFVLCVVVWCNCLLAWRLMCWSGGDSLTCWCFGVVVGDPLELQLRVFGSHGLVLVCCLIFVFGVLQCWCAFSSSAQLC